MVLPRVQYSLNYGWYNSHVPDFPERTAVRYVAWSDHRDYAVFQTVEQLDEFVKTQVIVPNSCEKAWEKWIDYKVEADKFAKIREENKRHFEAKYMKKK